MSLVWRARKRRAGRKLSGAARCARCRALPQWPRPPGLRVLCSQWPADRGCVLPRAETGAARTPPQTPTSSTWGRATQRPKHSPHLAQGARHRPVHLLVEFPFCIVVLELVEPDLLVHEEVCGHFPAGRKGEADILDCTGPFSQPRCQRGRLAAQCLGDQASRPSGRAGKPPIHATCSHCHTAPFRAQASPRPAPKTSGSQSVAKTFWGS